MRKWTPRSGTFGAGSKTSSGCGSGARRPLRLQDAHEDGVVESGVAHYGLTEAPFLHEAQLRVCRDGLLVEVEDAQAYAIEPQLLESVAQEAFDSLGPVTLVAIIPGDHYHREVRRP